MTGAPSSHDDRKGRHYYTPASLADASVYSSDDPCGRHGVGTVVMGWGRSSWGGDGHHGVRTGVMGRGGWQTSLLATLDKKGYTSPKVQQERGVAADHDRGNQPPARRETLLLLCPCRRKPA